MIQKISLFILLLMCCYIIFKIYNRIKSREGSIKNVHWNENLDIDETYSAEEYDRHSDYLRRL
jgi:hypothetical protein